MSLDATVRELVRAEVDALASQLRVRDLTLAEVAEELRVSVRHVRKLIAHPNVRLRLQAYNAGYGDERADWRVTRAELDRWKREAGR